MSLAKVRIILLLLLTAAVSHAQTGAGYTNRGSLPVDTLPSLLLGNGAYGTEFEARIFYPRAEGPFPVIAFSHGLGGNKDIFTAVTAYWASHGYVVIQPSHHDEGVNLSDLPALEVQARKRLENIVTALNSLERIEQAIPELDGKLDASRLAVAGHSYGSFITLLAGGLTVDLGAGDINLGLGNLRCMAPISPSGRGAYGIHDGSFDSISLPAMYFTGTRDIRTGREQDWRKEPYYRGQADERYLIVITDASHGQFGGDVESDAPLYVQAATTAFWDFCLKGNESGRRWLRDASGFAAFAGERATIEAD